MIVRLILNFNDCEDAKFRAQKYEKKIFLTPIIYRNNGITFEKSCSCYYTSDYHCFLLA